ncbi:hypothetical protein JCM8547_006482 [Rhodosporidiobolus lusitaniae]
MMLAAPIAPPPDEYEAGAVVEAVALLRATSSSGEVGLEVLAEDGQRVFVSFEQLGNALGLVRREEEREAFGRVSSPVDVHPSPTLLSPPPILPRRHSDVALLASPSSSSFNPSHSLSSPASSYSSPPLPPRTSRTPPASFRQRSRTAPSPSSPSTATPSFAPYPLSPVRASPYAFPPSRHTVYHHPAPLPFSVPPPAAVSTGSTTAGAAGGGGRKTSLDVLGAAAAAVEATGRDAERVRIKREEEDDDVEMDSPEEYQAERDDEGLLSVNAAWTGVPQGAVPSGTRLPIALVPDNAPLDMFWSPSQGVFLSPPDPTSPPPSSDAVHVHFPAGSWTRAFDDSGGEVFPWTNGQNARNNWFRAQLRRYPLSSSASSSSTSIRSAGGQCECGFTFVRLRGDHSLRDRAKTPTLNPGQGEEVWKRPSVFREHILRCKQIRTDDPLRQVFKLMKEYEDSKHRMAPNVPLV